MFNPFKQKKKIKMQQLTVETVEGFLRSVKNNYGDDVLASGIVSSVIVNEGKVGFLIHTDKTNSIREAEEIRDICQREISKISGVEKITAVLTSEDNKAVKEQRQKNIKGDVKPPNPKPVEGINKIIAVASGKGGVGKSTIAANLALSLSLAGKKVGLVDADIHGPSIARIMAISGEPEINNNKMIPPVSNGIKCMSMGLLIGENAPVVWRGPMITKALSQLMLGANWGELDFLIIDMPPGTGDIQLSLLQNYKVDGVVMVSTPQEIALLDVKKATSMFVKLGVKIIGLVENMAYFTEGQTGKKVNIFGQGKVDKFCTENNITKLCEVPIHPEISKICDEGLSGENLVSEKLKTAVLQFLI